VDTFDVSVSLFSGETCGELTCVSGTTFTDQMCTATNETESDISLRFLQEDSNSSLGPLTYSTPGSFTLDSEDGVTYYVFVHGQDPSSLDGSKSSNGVGDFDLSIRSLEPPTSAPTTFAPTTAPREQENDGSAAKSNNNKLNYLYLLLLLLLIPPLWIFRERLCCCLPCFKDDEERDPSKPTNEIDMEETHQFQFQEETPFQDETGARKNGDSDDTNGLMNILNAEKDRREDDEKNRKMESSSASSASSPKMHDWQTLEGNE